MNAGNVKSKKTLPFRLYELFSWKTLFAAIELAQGRLIGTCMSRHRHQEWIKFLKLIDAQTPAELELHIIADNYATHKHPKVHKWLARHKRFHMHFTPTSSSWLNLIERWFRDLTDKCIRRGAFADVPELIQTITDYIDALTRTPDPLLGPPRPRRFSKKSAAPAQHWIICNQRETLH